MFLIVEVGNSCSLIARGTTFITTEGRALLEEWWSHARLGGLATLCGGEESGEHVLLGYQPRDGALRPCLFAPAVPTWGIPAQSGTDGLDFLSPNSQHTASPSELLTVHFCQSTPGTKKESHPHGYLSPALFQFPTEANCTLQLVFTKASNPVPSCA